MGRVAPSYAATAGVTKDLKASNTLSFKLVRHLPFSRIAFSVPNTMRVDSGGKMAFKLTAVVAALRTHLYLYKVLIKWGANPEG